MPHLSSLVLAGVLLAQAAAAGSIHKVGTEASGSDGHLTVTGSVGSGPFDPAKVGNWMPDAQSPLIAPLPGGTCPDANGNIYNPSIVSNDGAYNVYFGGWDGVKTCKDSVSVTVTSDNFKTFGEHVPAIKTGTRHNLNNPNALKVNSSFWAMIYTQESFNQVNKPGVSTSSAGGRTGPPAGLDWTPSAGTDKIISMQGYPYDWGNATAGANVNGGNVILLDEKADTWHLWFTDLKQFHNHSVFHATAPGGKLGEFTFQGAAVKEPGYIVNDVKLINGYHVLGMHHNGPDTYFSASKDPTAFPAPKVLFNHYNDADAHIVSVGLVVDPTSTRLMGALYGACADTSLMRNRIYGQWLQKRVLFQATKNGITQHWGAKASAHGPDSQILESPVQSEVSVPAVGKFYIYDSDYVDINNRGTLLYTSDEVTVAAGDVWEYSDRSPSVDPEQHNFGIQCAYGVKPECAAGTHCVSGDCVPDEI